MSIKGAFRQPEPARGTWIGFDPRVAGTPPLRLDRSSGEFDSQDEDEQAEALNAEARHTGMLVAIGLPAGVLITWFLDVVVGGPGIGTMVGL